MATKKATMRKTKAKKKRRGRPPKKTPAVTVKATDSTIPLPINPETDVEFWENILRFARTQKGAAFYIRLDGERFTLLAK